MLQNTLYKLTHEKKLTLGFFGGSDTDGTGASDTEKTSYRALVTAWFKESYPDCEIISINASIGGTGTGYGMFRCERELIAYCPDLIFLEYAGNDWGDDYDAVLPQVEAIFRKIRRDLPYTDIITVMCMYTPILEELERGIEYTSRSAHTTASHHYGIPTVDVGAALQAFILRSGGDYKRYIPDGAHYNDTGHRVLADCIAANIKRWFDMEDADTLVLSAHPLPAPFSTDRYDNATILTVDELEELQLDGFFVSERNNKRFPKYLVTDREGASFSFSFTGRGFGFAWISSNMNGDVLVSIDGGAPIRVKSWDHYIRSFQRLRASVVTTDLDYTRHTVKVTSAEFTPTEVSPERVVQMEGILAC